MDLYQQTLMDHYRHPRNRGTLDNADFKSGLYNPSCGDKVSLEGCIQEGVLTAIAFEATGCVISLATASLLTELVIGKSVEDIAALNKEFLQTVIGIELGPIRLKCALLPLQALQEGIAIHMQSRSNNECSTTQSLCEPLNK
jgi:nitrogen fixation NifU-like protein